MTDGNELDKFDVERGYELDATGENQLDGTGGDGLNVTDLKKKSVRRYRW